MPAVDDRPVVFFTTSNFPDVIGRPNGHTSRTRGLMRGCADLGGALHVIWLRNRAATELSGPQVEQMIRTQWGIDCTVHCWDLQWPAGRSFLHYFVWPLLTGIRRHPEFPFLSADTQGQVRRCLEALHPRLVVAQMYQAFMIHQTLGRRDTVICDYNDIEHLVYQRKVRTMSGWGPRWIKRLQIPLRTRLDRDLMRQADLTLVCAEGDREYLRRRFGPLPLAVVPNALPDAAQGRIFPEGRHGLLFVGDLRYPPNLDALVHYAQDVHPQLVALGCRTLLKVVGPGQELVPASVRQQEDIQICGFVDSLDPYYQDAQVVICPIRVGGGTRVKLIEAAAYGKAIVSTRMGAEGLAFEQDRSILLADAPAQFAAALVRCLKDPALRGGLGQSARALFMSKFDERVQRAAFVEAVSALEARPANERG